MKYKLVSTNGNNLEEIENEMNNLFSENYTLTGFAEHFAIFTSEEKSPSQLAFEQMVEDFRQSVEGNDDASNDDDFGSSELDLGLND
jgi:hypothetical protein